MSVLLSLRLDLCSGTIMRLFVIAVKRANDSPATTRQFFSAVEAVEYIETWKGLRPEILILDGNGKQIDEAALRRLTVDEFESMLVDAA